MSSYLIFINYYSFYEVDFCYFGLLERPQREKPVNAMLWFHILTMKIYQSLLSMVW